jgi:hypothetical protein
MKGKTSSHDGDTLFLHGFQQSRLRFCRSPVDFVCQNNIGKNRSFYKLEMPFPHLKIILYDICTCNVGGHQIRSELDALESKV